MTCSVRHFDRFILKPIFWLFSVAAVAFLIGFHWWCLAGAVLGSFYTGIIGAKLHPRQSFSDLATGSLTEPAATKEEVSLSALEQRLLVSHACTRVGILVGVTLGIILWSVIGWRWYFASIVGFVCLMFSGAILKLLFKSV
jgi:hypothetical protein